MKRLFLALILVLGSTTRPTVEDRHHSSMWGGSSHVGDTCHPFKVGLTCGKYGLSCSCYLDGKCKCT